MGEVYWRGLWVQFIRKFYQLGLMQTAEVSTKFRELSQELR